MKRLPERGSLFYIQKNKLLDFDGNVIGPNPWHNTVNYFCVPDQFGLDTLFVHKICAKFLYTDVFIAEIYFTANVRIHICSNYVDKCR